MRLSLIALLCAGTTAFGQSPAQRPADPDTLFQMPERFTHPEPDFKQFKPLPSFESELVMPLPWAPLPLPDLNNPRIDPKMIVRPPWPRADQSKGQEVSRNLYPNLKFLPLHCRAQNCK